MVSVDRGSSQKEFLSSFFSDALNIFVLLSKHFGIRGRSIIIFLVLFCQAEEMAQTFRQRIAQAEAMARADMLRFQPEVRVQFLYS